eukprot:sb/3477669/
MTQMDKILHKFLGDTHHGRLVDKFGNFATENFGDKGLQFFNSLTACQVLYQLYESRRERKEVAGAILGKIVAAKITEYCKKEKDPVKQKQFAAKELAVFQAALATL